MSCKCNNGQQDSKNMGAGQKTVYWLLSLHPCLSCKCYWDNSLKNIDLATIKKEMEFQKNIKKRNGIPEKHQKMELHKFIKKRGQMIDFNHIKQNYFYIECQIITYNKKNFKELFYDKSKYYGSYRSNRQKRGFQACKD